MNRRFELAIEGTLESFFFEQLEQAQETERKPLGDEIEAYLVHMLAAHARRPNVAGRTGPALATQLLAAREQGAGALREVGDQALYSAAVGPRARHHTPDTVH